jgi:hypothetical protein
VEDCCAEMARSVRGCPPRGYCAGRRGAGRGPVAWARSFEGRLGRGCGAEDNHGGHGVSRSFCYQSGLPSVKLRVLRGYSWDGGLSPGECTASPVMAARSGRGPACRGVAVEGLLRRRVASGVCCVDAERRGLRGAGMRWDVFTIEGGLIRAAP